MALELDPKFIGTKIKLKDYSALIEIKPENEKLLLNLGQLQYFKQKKDVSNNEKPSKPTVHKRKRKSNVGKS